MVGIRWSESYRIIYSRYPFIGIYDRIADPADLENVIALELRTNPRALDDIGALSLVRRRDRIAGPGTTPIMAAFTHSKPSRFSDGSFGIYYAAKNLSAAIAESRFHVSLFYRSTREQSADIDMRVYVARIHARFGNLRSRAMTDPLLDPNSYSASQIYGKALYGTDKLDGIVYPSVRDDRHRAAAACFRPRVVSDCHSHSYLQYRWDGIQQMIVDVVRRESLAG